VAVRTILQLGDPGLRDVAARSWSIPVRPEVHVLVCRFGGYAGALASQHWIWTRDCSAADWRREKRVIFLQLPGAESVAAGESGDRLA